MRKKAKRKQLLFIICSVIMLAILTACGSSERESGQIISASEEQETESQKDAIEEKWDNGEKKDSKPKIEKKDYASQIHPYDIKEDAVVQEKAMAADLQEPDEENVSVSQIASKDQNIEVTIQGKEECYDEEEAESGVRLSSVYVETLTVDVTDNTPLSATLNSNIEYLASDYGERGWELACKAKEDRLYLSEDELAYWSPYSISERYRVERVDRQVLSLVREYSEYDQINHSHGYRSTENYSMDTGNRIFLKDICTDMEGMYEIVAEELKNQNKKSDDTSVTWSAQDSLQEDTWYLSEDGLGIICNSGTRLEDTEEFCIDYDELNDVLETKYLPKK